MRSSLVKLWDYGVPLLSVAWLVGLIVKDRWWLSSFAFYVPPLALAILVPLWILMAKNRINRFLRVCTGLIALLAVVKIIAGDSSFRERRPATGDAVRLVHWNTMDMPFGISRVMDVLKADAPDICVLSELRASTAFSAVALSFFPGGDHYKGQNILVMSRYPIEVLEDPIERSRSAYLRLMTDRGPVDLLAVDLDSSLLKFREPYVREIDRFLEQRSSAHPLLVVGDFNTPRASVHFKTLREHMRLAYEDSFGVWPYSWPFPVPAFSIDHLWVTPDIEVQAYELRASFLSDHLRQVADVRW